MTGQKFHSSECDYCGATIQFLKRTPRIFGAEFPTLNNIVGEQHATYDNAECGTCGAVFMLTKRAGFGLYKETFKRPLLKINPKEQERNDNAV